jgi:hypothetical protein
MEFHHRDAVHRQCHDALIAALSKREMQMEDQERKRSDEEDATIRPEHSFPTDNGPVVEAGKSPASTSFDTESTIRPESLDIQSSGPDTTPSGSSACCLKESLLQQPAQHKSTSEEASQKGTFILTELLSIM